ncbi:conserved hypothetical protein [uncultured Pleomorphomonas sp.]|uniref:Uncharacterized protein n=1 Tax=uncultured Pleomorphomonas sp. TaxID=442121 RepID=A0A212LH16_9HYPH|nr:conserved hypothetical protein [uncultured Pleomorphomonas sp.]
MDRSHLQETGIIEFLFRPHFAFSFAEEKLATPAGLEPATCRLEGGCSIQLSYGALEPAGTDVNASRFRPCRT